jgi:hypothetical protein
MKFFFKKIKNKKINICLKCITLVGIKLVQKFVSLKLKGVEMQYCKSILECCIYYQNEKVLSIYLKVHAMTKINPGARFGMAVAIAGEVSWIPLRNRVWNKVTL